MKDRSLFWGDWWLFYKPAWPNCQQFNSLLYTCMLGSVWIWSGLSVNVFLYFQQVMGGGGGASYQTKQFSKRHYESICFFFDKYLWEEMKWNIVQFDPMFPVKTVEKQWLKQSTYFFALVRESKIATFSHCLGCATVLDNSGQISLYAFTV